MRLANRGLARRGGFAVAGALPVDTAVWEGKDAAKDYLRVTDVRLEGDATSSVRKGGRIVVYDWKCEVRFEGRRGGAAGIAACVTLDELEPQDAPPETARAAIASEPLADVADEAGRQDVERAMRTHEALGKLVERKGVPLVRAALRTVVRELEEKI